MKLISFNIQNYRSIVHSGWSNLAPDNITALIGQNESGKTSVLEALQSFYDGIIHEDILRSDLTLPLVHCKFGLDENIRMKDIFEVQKIPAALYEMIQSKTEFSITRKWIDQKKSTVFISDEEIMNFFESREVEKARCDEKIMNEISKLLILGDEVFRNIGIIEKEVQEGQNNIGLKKRILEDTKKTLRKSTVQEEKLVIESKLNFLQSDLNIAVEHFQQTLEQFEKNKKQVQDLSEKISFCKACNDAVNRFFELQTKLDVLKSSLKEEELQNSQAKNDKQKKLSNARLEKLRIDFDNMEKIFVASRNEQELLKSIVVRVISDMPYRQAEVEAKQEIEKENRFYTLIELGEAFFKHIPVFEFFEDFSSLLPNKIDLDDILNENTYAEGYKAAKNFLQIAGLNAEFFREQNHRILKQKIENLNGEITIDFQDFWSQNIGKNNKIRINFELEHYDYTHPEKSGKPYLEFWIKDKMERLYPKQRSRGVRWFLSFYLELRALAKMDSRARIMLIDEPGLSLHARAQEDVLKVFEDLKEKMQIIYCTHSPHLINLNRLYRILPVQRADENDDRSETLVLNADLIYSASADTLSPVYALMGVKLTNQNFIHPRNNVIIEDTIGYYYLNAIYKLAGESIVPHFIPATGLTNVPILSNILFGWKVDFSILLLGVQRSASTAEELNRAYFIQSETGRILKLEKFEYPEDLFSTLDFKKYILQNRVGITEKNSDFITNNNLSRTLLASQFLNNCVTQNLTLEDFDEDTKMNINSILNKFRSFLS